MNWISVNDRLPEIYGVYLVINKYNVRFIAKFYLDEFDCNNSFFDADDITHWMPLPKPPQNA